MSVAVTCKSVLLCIHYYKHASHNCCGHVTNSNDAGRVLVRCRASSSKRAR